MRLSQGCNPFVRSVVNGGQLDQVLVLDLSHPERLLLLELVDGCTVLFAHCKHPGIVLLLLLTPQAPHLLQ